MLKKARTNVYNLNYHIIWATKHQAELLKTPSIRAQIKDLITHVGKLHGIAIKSCNVYSEHIDMLVSFPPVMSVSSAIKSLKGRSGRIWFKQHPNQRKTLFNGHLWAPTFYAESLGHESKSDEDRYLNNQILNYRK